MTPPLDDIVSPELALVDPELAARARAVLASPAAARPILVAARREAPAATSSSRSSRRLVTPALTLLATAAASLIVTSFTGPDRAGGESPTGAGATAPERIALPRTHPARLGASSSEDAVQPREDDGAPASPPAGPQPAAGVSGGRTSTHKATAPGEAAVAPRAPRVAAATATIVWPRSANASSYDLELVRGGTVIYSARSGSPEVVVPREWRRGGVSYTIQPEDQAFVWPVVDGRRAAAPIVNGALALDMTLVTRFAEGAKSSSQP